MNLDFQHGIVTYPANQNLQSFLAYQSGYVSINAANGYTLVTFAYGSENYLHSENVSVPQAWGPLQPNVDYWLYWDLNPLTGVRTFGFTEVQPILGGSQPTYGEETLHWFDPVSKKMHVVQNGILRPCIRAFAAKVRNGTFTPLGSNQPARPFAGSQVGLNQPNTVAGHLVFDLHGKPIRKSDGSFFTSTNDAFIAGSAVNTVRLESAVLYATAAEPIAKFTVVRFSAFDLISPASYDDISTSSIAILMEDLETGEVGAVCVQGVITNASWNWPLVGAPLWLTSTGALTAVDPYAANPLAYPVQKSAIARVISPTKIIFDQALGGKGDKGDPGDAGGSLASNSVVGITRLSVPPANSSVPIAVGDNDPRIGQAVLRNGDTMTGALVLSGAPTANLHAATKQYVDALAGGADKVNRAGDTMTGALVLSGAPTASLHAATKQYVDSKIVPYDLTLACSDSITELVVTTNAAFAVAPRAFTTSAFQAHLVSASTAGNVIATVRINGIVVATLTIPANLTAVTVNATSVVPQGATIRINIDSPGTAATGLSVNVVGAL